MDNQEMIRNSIRKSKSQLNDYARYSGMAFQMIAIVFAGIFGGIQLDKLLNIKFPIFTVSLSLLSVFLGLYLMLKDFLKKKK